MAENVFNICQLGRQAGTFYEPGAAVAGRVLYPVSDPIAIELDRASRYPAEDYGYNWDAYPSRGSHGVRGATLSINSEARFHDLMDPLEMHWAGDITPVAGVWVYPFETGAPTLVPYTARTGSESTEDQWYAQSVLIDEMTLGFDDLDAPGIHPWTIEGSALGVNRVSSGLTAGVDAPPVLESMQGHLSTLAIGSTSTAFEALDELAATLISFFCKTMRHLVLRPYGSTGDVATGYGFSAKSEGEVTFKVRINAETKSVLHDAWNSDGADLGELRGRVTVIGSGTNQMDLDFRAGLTAVPIGERDGERVYECTGKLVRDGTLSAPAQITLDNGVTSLLSEAAYS